MIKVTEIYENGIKQSVEVIAGQRILYFSCSLNPILCFYTPPLKPGRIRRLSRQCKSITRKEFNVIHENFIKRMKLKAIRRINNDNKFNGDDCKR